MKCKNIESLRLILCRGTIRLVVYSLILGSSETLAETGLVWDSSLGDTFGQDLSFPTRIHDYSVTAEPGEESTAQSVCGYCHMPPKMGETMRWTPNATEQFSGGIETFIQDSRRCLDCHMEYQDLEHGHPLGVTYPAVTEKGGYKVPGPDISLGPQGTVECISCHNPHGSVHPRLLQDTMRASKLCLNCHEK